MTDISRHSLLKQAYDVCQEIEKCGASPQLTSAVTKASDLLRALDAYIPVQSCDPEKFIIPELPQYKCHKVVRAARIQTCLGGVLGVQVGDTKAIVEIEVGRAWVERHKPEHGGYLVAYEDNYLSYSPADVFEAGYHELPPLGTACGGTADAAPATNMVGATGGSLAEIDLNAADFSDALMWLKEGRRVARAGWRNDKYLFLSTCQWSTHAGSHEEQKIKFRANNSGGDWAAMSDDMLATDWLVVR